MSAELVTTYGTQFIIDWDCVEMDSTTRGWVDAVTQAELARVSYAVSYEEAPKEWSQMKLGEKSVMGSRLVLKDVHTHSIPSLLFLQVDKFRDFYMYGYDGLGRTSNIDVDFQRDFVWSLKQKQGLVLSLLERLPVGSFYINSCIENGEIDHVLYDGKQRLSAIVEFLQGGLPYRSCW